MTIRIALGAALVLAASVPARAAARFLVGASAADITPPLAATAASNPADCDASGLYNGAHLFSLEEPYYKKVYVNGVEQPQAPNGSEQGNQVKTRRAKVVRSRPARRPVTGVIDRGRDSLLGADFQPDDWRSSMSDGAMQRLRFGRLLVLACATAFLGLVPLASGVQAPECLIEVNDQSGAVADNGTVCAVAPAGSKFCTINLELCHNVGTCSAGPLKGKARTTGHCNPGKLKVSSTDSSCGAFTGVKVRTKKNGSKMGKCLIRVQAHAGHGQNDVDKVTLECMPSGSSCGASPSGAFLDSLDRP